MKSPRTSALLLILSLMGHLYPTQLVAQPTTAQTATDQVPVSRTQNPQTIDLQSIDPQIFFNLFESFWKLAKDKIGSADDVSNRLYEHFSEQRHGQILTQLETSKSFDDVADIFNDFLLELEIPNATIYLPSTLDYYLYQAAIAPKNSQRKRINHIGVSVKEIDDQYIVSNVLAHYPAQQLDLRRGDILNTVNGSEYHPVTSFNQLGNSRAQDRSKQNYELGYSRNGQAHTVSISPVFENLYDSYSTVTINSNNRFSSGNKIIGYVQILATSRSLNDLITYQSLFNDFSDCDGIIVDLRDAFGYLQWEHFDPFFSNRNRYFERSVRSLNGTLLQHETAPRKNNRYYYDRPLVILINENTRADIELLAYQLKKLSNTTVIGSPTRGFPVADNSLVTDSEFSFVLALPTKKIEIDGEIFNGLGVLPNYELHNPIDRSAISDLQLEAGISTLMNSI